MSAERVRLSIALLISIGIHGVIASFGDFSGGGDTRTTRIFPVAVTIATIADPMAQQAVQAAPLPKSEQKPPTQSSNKVVSESVKPTVSASPSAIPAQEAPVQSSKSETNGDDMQESSSTEAVATQSAPMPGIDQVQPIDAVLSTSVMQTTSTPGANELKDSGQSAAAERVPTPETPDVTAVPHYHLIPKPSYPSRSRELGEEGIVIVAVLVSKDGTVLQVYVTESSGYPLLDGSALTTVKEKWHFKPGLRRGHAISSWVRVPIKFSIKGSQAR